MSEREIAIDILENIISEGAYNNIILRKTLNQASDLTSVQKALITQLVNGTLRNLIHIDYIIGKFSKTPVRKIKPFILNSLRIGIYQIMYMDKIPVSAACNEAVKIVKRRGFYNLSGFVNGILRNVARNKNNIQYPDNTTLEYLSIKYSYPQWILEYWSDEFDFDSIKAICEANNIAPKITICVNTNRISKTDLIKRLISEGIEANGNTNLNNSIYISKINNISESKCYKEGLFHIMDESSMLCIKALSPKNGSIVVDVCAAPGGKSFACAYAMNNKGQIISRDVYGHKTKLIDEGSERLGTNIIKTEIKDALETDSIKADYVIIDAPCSGLGLVRKKPDIKYNKTIEDIKSLAGIQRKILSVCQNMVNENGVLLYSTCTISHKENIDNVKWFCENYNFELEDLTPYLPENIKFETIKYGYIQITPDKMDSDGFFIARLRRKQ